jgi:hypothetical protein
MLIKESGFLRYWLNCSVFPRIKYLNIRQQLQKLVLEVFEYFGYLICPCSLCNLAQSNQVRVLKIPCTLKKQDLINLMVMLGVSYPMLPRNVSLYKQRVGPPC